jgi:hypothetical protein
MALFLLFSGVLKAQQVSVKQILKYMKAKDMEWVDEEDNLAKVKMKSTKKWGIYRVDASVFLGEEEIDYEEIIAPKFDSIGWFKDMQPFTIVKNNNKYGILLNPYEITNASEKVKCRYDAIKIIEKDERYYALVRDGKKWGLVDWFENIYLVDPSFESPEEVPLVWVEPWAIDIFLKSKNKLGADILVFDEGNGDGVFKARDKITKKWGMYQSWEAGNIITAIPAKYDSINFFPFNGMYTAVYNEGKVGIYLSYWAYGSKAKQTVSCIYDNYKRFDADGIPKLAVQKNGKWGWIDWLTGEEKSEFIFETTKDLPYPHFQQDIWIED